LRGVPEKRIIHMSDLHVGHKDLGERFRRITKALISREGDRAAEYVVVITGDLVEDANDPSHYREVKARFEDLKEAGFEHILVVPGNHDYGTGSHGDKKFVQLFKRAFFGNEMSYPTLHIIAEVAFIGLDSMAEELHWYDALFAEGELGHHQLARLEEMLRSRDVSSCAGRVIYLHHHPFDWLPLHQLKDAHALGHVLRRAIRDGISIDAVLYGHNHLGRAHNGRWGIPRCYDAGTATLRERGKWLGWLPWCRVRNSTRVIDLSRNPEFDRTTPLF